MDSSQPHTAFPLNDQQEDDEWDTDGFIIPSLGIEDTDQTKPDASDLEAIRPPSPKAKIEKNIYLGPHGAPPSQSKQQELNSSGRKQRFKQKLKEADKRISGTGRENKLENLRELVGGGKERGNMKHGSPRDWLDPHCHESQFEKRCPESCGASSILVSIGCAFQNLSHNLCSPYHSGSLSTLLKSGRKPLLED